MSKKQSLEEVLNKLGVKQYIKIGDGKKASFYVSISEYKKELRIMFLTVNERSNWIGGKYAIPASMISKVINALIALELELEETEANEENET